MIAKILIVDDNGELRASLRDALTAKGHIVLEASDGAQAFAIAEKELPHIIVSDVVLPGVYGTTAVKTLNEFYKTAKIPIILMSGSVDGSFLKDVLDRPNVRYLKKPFEVGALEKLIREMLPDGGYTA